jgi:hypothetical protein
VKDNLTNLQIDNTCHFSCFPPPSRETFRLKSKTDVHKFAHDVGGLFELPLEFGRVFGGHPPCLLRTVADCSGAYVLVYPEAASVEEHGAEGTMRESCCVTLFAPPFCMLEPVQDHPKLVAGIIQHTTDQQSSNITWRKMRDRLAVFDSLVRLGVFAMAGIGDTTVKVLRGLNVQLQPRLWQFGLPALLLTDG